MNRWEQEAERLLRSLRYPSTIFVGAERALVDAQIEAFIPAVAAALQSEADRVWKEAQAILQARADGYEALRLASDDGHIPEGQFKPEVEHCIDAIRQAQEKESGE